MATIQRGTSSHSTDGNVLNTHVHLMTPNTWAPLMDPVSQELTGGDLKKAMPKYEPSLWKLTWEEKLRSTTQVNA